MLYDVEVGRFLNADDVHYLGEAGISCNLFTYCENNVVNSIDSNGMLSISKGSVKSIVGDFVSFAISWLSLAGKVKSLFSSLWSAYCIASGTKQYVSDYNYYKHRNQKRMLKIVTVAFIICVVSNAISILLDRLGTKQCKDCIRQFFTWFGRSFCIAMSMSQWAFDLALISGRTYKTVKAKTKEHY